MLGGLAGFIATLIFLPICFAVIGFARRAQRARLGSIVAACDARAVWSILAITLGAMTLTSVLDWAAARAGGSDLPLPALAMVVASIAVVAMVLALDVRAMKRANEALADLVRPPASSIDVDALHIDLGLGTRVRAQVTRSTSPYRELDRTRALVHGSPRTTRAVIRRAIRRGMVGLALLAVTVSTQAVANSRLGESMWMDARYRWDRTSVWRSTLDARRSMGD